MVLAGHPLELRGGEKENFRIQSGKEGEKKRIRRTFQYRKV